MVSDLLRFVVLALTAFDLGAIAIVIWLNWKAWRAAPKGMGLVPFHVWVISLAHGGMIVSLIIGILQNLRQPVISVRVWVFIFCLLLTAVALVAIGKFQRRRVQYGREETTTTTTRTTTKLEE